MDGKKRPETSEVLTAKQLRLLELVLTSRSLEQAAKRGKVSVRQLYRWRQTPTFRDELRRRSHEILDGVQARLRVAAGAAVEVLLELATSKQTAESVRATSAGKLLDLAIRAEVDDISSRLEALEMSANP